MSKLTFDEAFKRLIGHEGRFTNDRNDRGNWTTGIIGKGQLKVTKYGKSLAEVIAEVKAAFIAILSGKGGE